MGKRSSIFARERKENQKTGTIKTVFSHAHVAAFLGMFEEDIQALYLMINLSSPARDNEDATIVVM